VPGFDPKLNDIKVIPLLPKAEGMVTHSDLLVEKKGRKPKVEKKASVH
jgi:hypothetical protein